MSECKDCINALLRLGSCGKRRAELRWPADVECIMEMPQFPDANNCDYFIDRNAGEAIELINPAL